MADTLQHWMDVLVPIELPVLARTLTEIDKLRDDPDNVSTQKLAEIVSRDPMMAVRVLRYLQQHRSRRRSTDITTLGHALMMVGVYPFFEQFGQEQTLETQLAGNAGALRGALAVINRAHHTALYAQDFAQVRHDLDADEIVTAALLHDFAEILLWCNAPAQMQGIAQRMEADPVLRLEHVELDVLGFNVIDLNLALIQAWDLPELLPTLLDDRESENARVLNVSYAAELARHSEKGWKNLALLHDYFVIAKLLGLRLHAVERRVMEVGQRAARDAAYYGIKLLLPTAVLPREFG